MKGMYESCSGLCSSLGLDLPCKQMKGRLYFRLSNAPLQSSEDITSNFRMLVWSVVAATFFALNCPAVDPLQNSKFKQICSKSSTPFCNAGNCDQQQPVLSSLYIEWRVSGSQDCSRDRDLDQLCLQKVQCLKHCRNSAEDGLQIESKKQTWR